MHGDRSELVVATDEGVDRPADHVAATISMTSTRARAPPQRPRFRAAGGSDVAAPGPPRRRTLVVFGGLRVRLRPMDRAVGVLRRRVDRVELEVALAGIDHVVPHSRRDDDRPIVSDVVRLLDRSFGPPELDTAGPGLDTKE